MPDIKKLFQKGEPEINTGSPFYINHIGALDGLRALACLMVVCSHSLIPAGFLPNTFRYNLFLNGVDKLGVMLFFTLSGFLMSYLYLSKGFSTKNVWQYIVSRFSRIYPLFFCVIFLHWVYFYLGYTSPSPSISFVEMDSEGFWLHLFFLKGEGVFWTISTEFRFYAFFILVWGAYSLLLRKPAVLYSLLFSGFILLSMVKYDVQQIHLLYSLHLFLAGTIAGDIYARHHEKLQNALCGYEFFIFATLFFLSFPNIYQYFFLEEHLRFQDEMTAIICACLIISAASGGPLVQAIMGNKLARWLGAISFSVYLLHRPILAFFKAFIDAHQLPSNIGMFFIYLVITIAISAASYYTIEATSRKALKKLLIKTTGDK